MNAITFTPPPSAMRAAAHAMVTTWDDWLALKYYYSAMRAAAHAMVTDARKKGVLKDLVCCECGTANAHAHHEDYSKPNEITPLCNPCHRKRHAALGWGVRKPIGKTRRATLTVSLPKELRASVAALAAAAGVSVSEYIRRHFASTLTVAKPSKKKGKA